jgi:hypothetical protein
MSLKKPNAAGASIDPANRSGANVRFAQLQDARGAFVAAKVRH